MGDTFLTLTNFDYLTKHITLKFFPFLQLKGAYLYFFATGEFTRVDYLRIRVRLTIEISEFHNRFCGYTY